jgi:proteasome accessory factor C
VSPRPPADHAGRFRRVANMAAWLAEVGESTVEELAERFEVSEAQVREDLEILMNATYGAEDEALVDVSVDEEGEVVFWDREMFVRQLRLRPSDALAVIAAAEALAVVEDDETAPHLASALAKVRAAVDASSLVAVESHQLEHLADVRRAAEAAKTIHLRYYSVSRDAVSERDVDPHVVFMLAGQWYFLAHDHLSGDPRRQFRVDGIVELERTGRTFTRQEVAVPEAAFTAGEATREVVLRIPSSGLWVLEALSSVEVISRNDDVIEVIIPVSGEAWLAQLLVRLGPEAAVVEPEELRDVGRRLAADLLALYD